MLETGLARVVYVVDADAAVREGLSRLVDSAGLEAKPYEGLEEFLLQVPEGHGACALLDLPASMREPALLARLRATAAVLPIIALSADDDPEMRRVAREIGAQAFFRKPVDAAALLDSIEWVMLTDLRGDPI